MNRVLFEYTQQWDQKMHTSILKLFYTDTEQGRDSAVGIATRYGLDSSGDRFPVEARFSAPVQTGPGIHPASYTMGTGSLSRR